MRSGAALRWTIAIAIVLFLLRLVIYLTVNAGQSIA